MYFNSGLCSAPANKPPLELWRTSNTLKHDEARRLVVSVLPSVASTTRKSVSQWFLCIWTGLHLISPYRLTTVDLPELYPLSTPSPAPLVRIFSSYSPHWTLPWPCQIIQCLLHHSLCNALLQPLSPPVLTPLPCIHSDSEDTWSLTV